jgi:tyrosine-protein kinase Etk/Wzc
VAQVEVNLRDLYRVLRKRKLIFIVAPILMGLATFAFTEAEPPVFRSSVLLKITRSTTVAGLMTEIISYSTYDTMATQMLVITSQPVLHEVASRLHKLVPGENPQFAIDRLKGQITTEQLSGSDILAIKSSARSREEALDLANTLAEVYIQRYAEEKGRRLDETVKFIRQRFSEASGALAHAEGQLTEFKRVNRDVLLPAQGDVSEKQFQYQQRLADAETALAVLTRVQQSKEYEPLLQSYLHVDDPGTLLIADDVSKRAASVLEQRSRRAELLRFQTEASPQVAAVSDQIQSEERRLQVSIENLVRRLRSLAGEYERQSGNLARQKTDLDRQPEALRAVEGLEAIVKEKAELVSLLRKQLQDTEIQQKEKADEISIVERANTASQSAAPSRYYKTLIGALIGILIGGVFAFVLESMDTSIGTIEDVERYISAAVLGIIPHIEIEDVIGRMDQESLARNVPEEERARFARLATHFDPRSVVSESYRTLRTNIRSIMVKSGKKVLLISSSVIQEGKTTSSVNLAAAFAQAGQRTLLIDADLRRPYIDKIFGIDRTPGLAEILLGTVGKKECIRTVDDVILGKFGLRGAQASPGLEFLHLLPAGHHVDNPTELLNSPGMDTLIAEARREFDVVIFDVSPILPVADAFILAPKVDGVVLAYQIGRVARDVLKRTKLRIESLGGSVWGIIMNDIQAEIDYSQGYFQYYHYQYQSAAQHGPLTWGERLRERIGHPFGGRPTARKLRARAKSADRLAERTGSDKRFGPSPPGAPPDSGEELRDIMSITDED